MKQRTATDGTGAPSRRRQWPRPGGRWWLHQGRALRAALHDIALSPLGTALVVVAVAIALATPGTLYVLMRNMQRAAPIGAGSAQVSLFLDRQVSGAQAQQLANRVRHMAGVASVRVMSPHQALAEYARASGLEDVQQLLGADNPLPSILVVGAPLPEFYAHGQEGLLGQLRALPEVDSAQTDFAWIARLAAFLRIGVRLVAVVALLLGTGLLLVVGSAARATLLARRDLIAVARLCGAGDAWLRRPLLYTGLVFGFLGGVLAALVIAVMVAWLAPAVAELASLYGSAFRLRGPGPEVSLALPVLGALLGWLAARIGIGTVLHRLDI